MGDVETQEVSLHPVESTWRLSQLEVVVVEEMVVVNMVVEVATVEVLVVAMCSRTCIRSSCFYGCPLVLILSIVSVGSML